MPPSADWAINEKASSVTLRSPAASFIRPTSSSSVKRPKSKRWQRDRIVAGTFCGSVVARIKIIYSGGSSSVFKRALKALVDSMWTSSMMYTFLLPNCGG